MIQIFRSFLNGLLPLADSFISLIENQMKLDQRLDQLKNRTVPFFFQRNLSVWIKNLEVDHFKCATAKNGNRISEVQSNFQPKSKCKNNNCIIEVKSNLRPKRNVQQQLQSNHGNEI